MCYVTAYNKLKNDALNSIESVLKKYRLETVEFEPITVTLTDGRSLQDEVITGITFYKEKLCIIVLLQNRLDKVTVLRFADEMDTYSKCRLAEHVGSMRF